MNAEQKGRPQGKAKLRELTPFAIILGIVLAIVFGAANAYLGLRVGLTISASIPAAVISMGLMRMILKRESVLENNIVQTIGSAGESLAAGAIFTIPAVMIWEKQWGETGLMSFMTIFTLAIVGGVLGVIFMVPLRKALIVKEDGVLPYPEGTACAEVLQAGEEKGEGTKAVFSGLGIAAVLKFLGNGLKLAPEGISYNIDATHFAGTAFTLDCLPSLMGVGYIVGPKISALMFAGGLLGWFVLMPLIHMLGGSAVAEMGPSDLWAEYIRYIGAGAVATGGIISLIKSIPMIFRSFKESLSDLRAKDNSIAGEDISGKWILLLLLIAFLVMVFMPSLPVGFLGAILIIIFGFFFATVSARMVGYIGSSNNPVSGMTIATLLITTLILRNTGHIGHKGMLSAIAVGTVICIITAIAGDTSQDLKTGYIVGATPRMQQIGELIGVLASAAVIGWTIWLLNTSIGFGTPELPAPQATLMQMIVEGVMNHNLPWGLVLIGVFIGLAMELLGISVMPFAIGLYLPLATSSGIMVGGIVRAFADKVKAKSEAAKKEGVTRGTLFSAGLIAGESLMGVLLAIFALPFVGIASKIDISASFQLPQLVTLLVYILLGWLIVSKVKKAVKEYGR